MASFLKYMLNPYPTLHDMEIMFFFGLMNITFILQYVEAFFFLVFAIFYGIGNSTLMWCTWLQGMRGNVNLFYFQVIAMNAFVTMFFL